MVKLENYLKQNEFELKTNKSYGWDIVSLEDVCKIISGKNQSKVRNPNGIYPIMEAAVFLAMRMTSYVTKARQ